MIYLASQSPRRKLLLEQISVNFQTLAGEIDEEPLKDELPLDYVLRMATEKALSGWKRVKQQDYEEHPVLAADTSLTLDNKILGKPKDKAHAYAMLSQLRGCTHQVMTAVAITTGNICETTLSVSSVKMAESSDSQIKSYIETGESLDKAGSYAIQGMGAILVERIEGSYSGVMGLPLYETAKLLRLFDVPVWQSVFSR